MRVPTSLCCAPASSPPPPHRGKGIDYNAEVPFEKNPAPGFYDTGEEVEATKSMRTEFRPITIEEMEGKRRQVSHAPRSAEGLQRELGC